MKGGVCEREEEHPAEQQVSAGGPQRFIQRDVAVLDLLEQFLGTESEHQTADDHRQMKNM
ncbi:hypothetical protein [Plantactinospora sp. KLBMP9567]|uniref:hypothetical protein n=1 Tax=Plantactinospora sp. KLBMP9567 TaxID=3085900 RepID=UPI002981452A|nr:hypothetical protein [Plantactinospora sp. KLBMP9567]MDW5326723.1 hypothetical protein [Plantactinospora sp. KLBMP9567]